MASLKRDAVSSGNTGLIHSFDPAAGRLQKWAESSFTLGPRASASGLLRRSAFALNWRGRLGGRACHPRDRATRAATRRPFARTGATALRRLHSPGLRQWSWATYRFCVERQARWPGANGRIVDGRSLNHGPVAHGIGAERHAGSLRHLLERPRLACPLVHGDQHANQLRVAQPCHQADGNSPSREGPSCKPESARRAAMDSVKDEEGAWSRLLQLVAPTPSQRVAQPSIAAIHPSVPERGRPVNTTGR